MTQKKFILTLVILGTLLCTVIVVAPLLGSVALPWEKVWQASNENTTNRYQQIFFQIRIPRVLLAAIVGAALAASGVCLQALLRNPLATPFTLGIASGASLGAVIAIQLGLAFTWQGFSSLSLAAGIGALCAVSLVYFLGRRKGYLETLTLLLAGIALNFLATAIVQFIHFIADPFTSRQITHWTMGSLDTVGYDSLLGFAACILFSLLLMLSLARDLNLISVGDEEALSLGVQLARARGTILVATSLATGTAVAAAGPIGFIGLIVPHGLRLILGPDNRLLLPASILGGASFLVICDTLARSLLPESEIPVGVITAFLGCPFFIWLLRKRRRQVIF